MQKVLIQNLIKPLQKYKILTYLPLQKYKILPYLVSASVRLIKDMETARLQVQLKKVETEFPVLRAHNG
jgi:hypothetical protein